MCIAPDMSDHNNEQLTSPGSTLGGTETAKTVQETPDNADQPRRPLVRTEMGSGLTAVQCSIPKLKIVATREFLPTNLPTENGSCSPLQRLAAPAENVSR